MWHCATTSHAWVSNLATPMPTLQPPKQPWHKSHLNHSLLSWTVPCMWPTSHTHAITWLKIIMEWFLQHDLMQLSWRRDSNCSGCARFRPGRGMALFWHWSIDQAATHICKVTRELYCMLHRLDKVLQRDVVALHILYSGDILSHHDWFVVVLLPLHSECVPDLAHNHCAEEHERW